MKSSGKLALPGIVEGISFFLFVVIVLILIVVVVVAIFFSKMFFFLDLLAVFATCSVSKTVNLSPCHILLL